jgi:hypothetical protein
MNILSKTSPADAIASMKAFTQDALRAHADSAIQEEDSALDGEVVRLRELVCHLLLKNERLRQSLAGLPEPTYRIDGSSAI